MSRSARTLFVLVVVAATTATLVIVLLPGLRDDAPAPSQATPEPSRGHQPPTLRSHGREEEAAGPQAPAGPDTAGKEAAANQPEELVDVTYTLPRPPRGRVWVGADALFDPTIRRGTPRSLMSWPAAHLGGPAEAVLETIRAGRGGAPWKDWRGAQLEERDGYTLVIRTTKALHVKIESWLRDLTWVPVPTRQSIAHELAWMLRHGTRVEREWADHALAALQPVVRDWVEDAHEEVPAPAAVGAHVPDAPTTHTGPHVQLEWVLARAEKSLFQDIGIDYRHYDYPFAPKRGGFLASLDDVQWEVLERAMTEKRRVRKLGASKTTHRLGSPVQLAMDNQAVLHVSTTLSKNRRYITVKGRAHAMDSGVLVFAPSFTVKIPDTGSVWISIRDVIVGKPSREQELGIMLRVTSRREAGR